ncbi:DAF-16/FOXO Controlled, germline Tumor affecting [Ditylenchus destructor]|nr:DAF-16/FOXO Controlled, germline Tumor affecting [Ditylenchus destructor]
MEALCATALQSVWAGFDISLLNFAANEHFSGSSLLLIVCMYKASIVLGSVGASLFGCGRKSWICLLGASVVKLPALIILAVSLDHLPGIFFTSLSFLGYVIVGFCLGFSQFVLLRSSVIANSKDSWTLLILVVYAGLTMGHFVSTLLLDSGDRSDSEQVGFITTEMNYNTFAALKHMFIKARYGPLSTIFVSVFLQSSSLYPLHVLWRKTELPIEQKEDPSNAESLEPHLRQNFMKILCLTSLMAFAAMGIAESFPYYLFTYSPIASNKESIKYFHLHVAASLFGCLFYLNVISKKEIPTNFVLSLSFVGCGISICCFAFEFASALSAIIYGFSLSLLMPCLVLYLASIRDMSIDALICSASFGQLVFPLILTQILNHYGQQLYSTVNFLTLLIVVFLFICLLNVQSRLEKPTGKSQERIWQFFRGDFGMNRSRSIRKFISNVRGSLHGSLRGSRYRRLRRSPARSPLAREAPSSLGLHPNMATVKNYRSTQSSSKMLRPNVSIDEDPSTCVSQESPNI